VRARGSDPLNRRDSELAAIVVAVDPGPASPRCRVRRVSALSWSGGKDSALALHELRERSGPAPRALITTVTADYGRISMHGVRRELLSRQASAAGLPLVEVEIPAACSNDVYEQRMGHALAEAPLAEAETVAFGDLFLADIRAYREERLSRVGKQAIFPLWGRDTTELAREFIAAGFAAVGSTPNCSTTSRPTWTPVERTASSTPSSTPDPSSTRRLAASSARQSSATGSCSATCCQPTPRPLLLSTVGGLRCHRSRTGSGARSNTRLGDLHVRCRTSV
jgi:hypothetical protein